MALDYKVVCKECGKFIQISEHNKGGKLIGQFIRQHMFRYNKGINKEEFYCMGEFLSHRSDVDSYYW
ncbi:hypothetical protein UFOVP733_15 [uncultured Caudovirales phage]|uniref:Uncharacterized protein n=1 Tax=uncultured Caudovirales phage TaxID=2100421 RepID=A0A6J7X5I9_9CAUD|nr:hypothetical protein UFOVP733_15 [uncultured Caudovirales phage]CAB5224943.1 hypothetical protein UFOVP743_44 [uncultured Caudovirales phage]